MTRYQSRKHSIEALQNTGEDSRLADIRRWVASEGGEVWDNEKTLQSDHLVIQRPAGLIYLVRPGDWVCKANEGQFFAMRDDDFSSLYKGTPVW